jgi:hypothetical protein
MPAWLKQHSVASMANCSPKASMFTTTFLYQYGELQSEVWRAAVRRPACFPLQVWRITVRMPACLEQHSSTSMANCSTKASMFTTAFPYQYGELQFECQHANIFKTVLRLAVRRPACLQQFSSTSTANCSPNASMFKTTFLYQYGELQSKV